MLRSGLKVSIKHGNLESRNGIIIAPVIKLGKLVLSASGPFPDPLVSFLSDEGMKISLVTLGSRESGQEEKLLKLTGVYCLTNEKIEQFIQENPDVINTLTAAIAERVPASFLLQKSIQGKIKEISDSIAAGRREAQYTFSNDDIVTTYSFNYTDVAGRCVVLESSEGEITNKARVTARCSLTAKAPAQYHAGARLSSTKAHGFFAQSRAAGASAYTGDVRVENAVLDSGHTLKFLSKNNGDCVKLEIDEDTCWAERPQM